MFRIEKEYLGLMKPGKGGTSCWSSPSNIALIKYWGKKSQQRPGNPNLSFSLSESHTVTKVDFRIKKKKGLIWKFLFEDSKNPSFDEKLTTYFNSVIPFLPFLNFLELHIQSSNTFPHSSGIASSASSMSALSLCLLGIEEQIAGRFQDKEVFLKKASFISRLGSGSACRSVYPGYSVWGVMESVRGSSDLYSVPLNLPQNSFFNKLRDAILLVSSEKKKVSSSEGHKLMKSNPFRNVRYRTAKKNLNSIIEAMEKTDIPTFNSIIENEALTLHGLMMSSDPGYILMKEGTIKIINEVRKFRESTGIFLCFTLDAGPNVHLIYHDRDHQTISEFISDHLLIFTEKNSVIWDRLGAGPHKSEDIK